MDPVVFWQGIISPHMFGLAATMAEQGRQVTYVAQEAMSTRRAQQGWQAPRHPLVEVIIVEQPTQIAQILENCSAETIHLVQGVYANGKMEAVRKAIKERKLRWGATMESIDERSWTWPLKRMVYRSKFWQFAHRPDFVLAIGAGTLEWVVARGFLKARVFPFTYFIEPLKTDNLKTERDRSCLHIGVVGRLIRLKRVDLVIDAMRNLPENKCKLIVVGDGILRDQIEKEAHRKLASQAFDFVGTLPMMDAHIVISNLDCLVLASDHDGWGAVVTEALMAGVPAICSDACGSAEAVRASGFGGVFPKGNMTALRLLLNEMISNSPDRQQQSMYIANWAKCFRSEVGAEYLKDIIMCVYSKSERPEPPWLEKTTDDRS